MIRAFTRSIVVFVLLFNLAGCAGLTEGAMKTWKILQDPSIPVGEPEDRPSVVDISITSDENVNSIGGRNGAPLRLQIVEMTDNSMLMSADIKELDEGLQSALKTNYLVHTDYTLLPGQYKFVEPFELSEGARFIGVVGYFQNPYVSDWKKVIKVRPNGKIYHLSVHLRAKDIKLQRAHDED